jgi:N-alpha-acetyltransferase 15/16, NatA auxiliary subunit
MLQQCAQHTPTLIELYTLKAKILKHAGDVEGAAAAADKARSMDLADRYGPTELGGLSCCGYVTVPSGMVCSC